MISCCLEADPSAAVPFALPFVSVVPADGVSWAPSVLFVLLPRLSSRGGKGSPEPLDALCTRRDRAAARRPRKPLPRLEAEVELLWVATDSALEEEARGCCCQSASQRSSRSLGAWFMRSKGRRRLVWSKEGSTW